jgi:hypothetical protein
MTSTDTERRLAIYTGRAFPWSDAGRVSLDDLELHVRDLGLAVEANKAEAGKGTTVSPGGTPRVRARR